MGLVFRRCSRAQPGSQGCAPVKLPPYDVTCLKRWTVGLPSMNSPIARTNVLKYSSRRSTSEADQAKTVMVPTPSFTAGLIHVVD